jgi:DNA-binding beta-propeller fold protein YncE
MNKFLVKVSFGIFFALMGSYSFAKQNEAIVVVEEEANSVGIYNAETGQPYGAVKISKLPHEITISKDGRTAYVSNFGLHDFNATVRTNPGTSISVIDVPNHIEKYRFYTFDAKKGLDFSKVAKAPHGVKLRPPGENQLYVNLEDGDKMLVFDVNTKKLIKQFDISPMTHNFIFSSDGKELWLQAGDNGVVQIDPDTGKVLRQFKMAGVHGLEYTPDEKYLIASGKNEITLINPKDLSVYKHYDNLGLTQIIYSVMTPDQKYILAPAPRNNLTAVINVNTGQVEERIASGLDPIRAVVSPHTSDFAYLAVGKGNNVTKVNLKTHQIKNIYTGMAPNGLVFSKINSSFVIPRKKFTLGVMLPLSGADSSYGGQMMLGYEYWNTLVREAGGLYVNGQLYDMNIVYLDTQSMDTMIEPLTKEFIEKYKVDGLLGTYGTDAYQKEKEIAAQSHTLFVPLPALLEKDWKPDSTIASGADRFVTTKEFGLEYEDYYALKPTYLSTIAVASGIQLQQALFIQENFDYTKLTELFSKNHFYTFLGG